jgi:hypothetical protein
MAAGLGDLGDDRLCASRARGVVDDHVSAFSGKRSCDRGSDATRSSSDKGEFVFQRFRHAMTPNKIARFDFEDPFLGSTLRGIVSSYWNRLAKSRIGAWDFLISPMVNWHHSTLIFSLALSL